MRNSVYLFLMVFPFAFQESAIAQGDHENHPVIGGMMATKEIVDETLKTCACHDLPCWRSLTNERTLKQVDCVADIANRYLPIIGPAYELIKVAANTNLDFVDSAQRLYSLTQSPKIETPECIIQAGKALGESIESIKELGKGFVEVARGNGSLSQVGDFLKHVSTISGTLENMKLDDCEAVQAYKLGKASKEALEKFLTLKKDFLKSLALFRRDVIKPLTNKTNVLQKAGLFGTLMGCGKNITFGLKTLVENSMCIGGDLRSIKESNEAVGKTLSLKGSRLAEQAKYVGCNYCVDRNSGWSGGQAAYEQCNTCCLESTPRFDLKWSAGWLNSCRTTCAAAKTEGITATYTNFEVCRDVLKMPAETRHFRALLLEPQNRHLAAHSKEEGQKIINDAKGSLKSSLTAILKYFNRFDTGNDPNAQPDGFASEEDLKKVFEAKDAPKEARDSANYILDTARRGYFYRLVYTSCGEPHPRPYLTQKNIACALDEIEKYRDPIELPELPPWWIQELAKRRSQ